MTYLLGDQRSPLGAIHPGDFDLGRRTSVGPVDASQLWIHRNRCGHLQPCVNNRATIPSICLGHHDATPWLRTRPIHFGPIQIRGEPIDSHGRRLRATLHVQILCEADLGLSIQRINHIRSLDRLVITVRPEHDLLLCIVVKCLDALLCRYHIELLLLLQIQCTYLWPVRKDQHHILLLGLADATGAVREMETLAATARIGAVHVVALMRASVLPGGALIHVGALLLVVRRNDVAGIAGADVTPVGEIVAMMLATTAILFRAAARVMAAQLIAGIATIVGEVTDLSPLDAMLVGALVLRVKVAGFLLGGAQGHVVLVAAIAAVVDAIADLIACHAPMIGALEASQGIAIEVTANLWVLIAAIAAIVGAVAEIGQGDAQIVRTLETRFGTETTAGEAGRTANLVGHVATIAIAIAAEVTGNAVTRGALERTVLALITLTVQFVRVVATVVLVIALPAR